MKNPSAFATSAWHGHEPQELIDVEVGRNFLPEPFVVGLLDQAGERNETLRLIGRRLGQGLVWAPIFLPVLAQVVDAAKPLGPQEQAFPGMEAILEERPIHRLDQGVQAQVDPVIPARDGEGHLGKRSAGRGHARFPEEGEGKGLARLRRVERAGLKLDRAEPVEIEVSEAGEVDLERALQGRRQMPCTRRSPNTEGRPSCTSCHPPSRPRAPRGTRRRTDFARSLDRPAASAAGRAAGLPDQRPGAGVAWPRIRPPGSRCAGPPPGQAEEIRAGRLPPRAVIIRGAGAPNGRTGEDHRGAGQRRRHGQSPSTHGVTSEGRGRRGMTAGFAQGP